MCGKGACGKGDAEGEVSGKFPSQVSQDRTCEETPSPGDSDWITPIKMQIRHDWVFSHS